MRINLALMGLGSISELPAKGANTFRVMLFSRGLSSQ
ncbi:hypothetical protein EMEDMD4_910063 [Sinorhizobium medicae]|uniref:Uncharacterized protein n=1 Tax=Sinorhizobium medicae TaxID=110321 RepID=A0A508X7K0_9HYPH|nr:hypothetical protein EMEDMD4_910063 [Sinorhizobium medicae]